MKRPRLACLLAPILWAAGLAGGRPLTAAPAGEARLVIRADRPGPRIHRNLYGHFAEHLGRCIYGGIWVGEDSPIPNTRGIRNDVVAALRKIHIPVLRWPGGCFADEYHWQDGIGPRAQRPSMFNSHWGGVVENNHFGTHEFLDLCEQLDCDAYVCGNVGSGSVREMMEWVEYMTSDADSPMANLRRRNGRDEPWKVRYFGVGNESWGCGGSMTAEFYADQFRRYNTFVKNYPGNRIFRIACGANSGDYHWTEVMMDKVGRRMNGLSLHYYTVPTGNWGDKGSATRFDEAQWHATLRRALEMDRLIARHSAIMDRRDPDRRIGLMVDEWGVWHNVEPGTNPGFLYQQNTLRDALVAGITLNIFNQHCERVWMGNLAQTVNVLQAMVLTDGPRMVLTPSYHVFDLYSAHQDATRLPVHLECPDYRWGDEAIPALSVSVSRNQAGTIHVTICNLDPHVPATLSGRLTGAKVQSIAGRVLTAATMQAHNTFEAPETVAPAPFRDARLTEAGAGFTASIPAKSVVALALK